MKPKSARFLGMTNIQLGILGGTAGVALLLICGLSWFVFTLPPAEQPPAAPTGVRSTPTPTVAAVVVTPSSTASPEIPTSAPPPDGWVEFQTTGATLWMPGNFIGGDMTVNRAETINKVSRLGLYFKRVREAMNKAPSEVVMWVLDKSTSGSPVITTLFVTHEVKQEETSIDEYVQTSAKGTATAQSTTVYETNKITLLGRPARRVTYQQQITSGYDVAGVAYYIKDGNDFWVLDYNLEPNEYLDMLPVVEKSVATFHLVK